MAVSTNAWVAYDDQVRKRGIDNLVDDQGSWPLTPGTAYFGPWAMRHEQADHLWDGDPTSDLESWTSFPIGGPTELPVAKWVGNQLVQPTYMQMSGSVCRFESYLRIRDGRPKKKGPMRIEMATAATPCNEFVAEFATPVSIIYGRPNSDRANYAKSARKEDVHLVLALCRHVSSNPQEIPLLVSAMASSLPKRQHSRPSEAWTCRNTIRP